jgi:protein TonB
MATNSCNTLKVYNNLLLLAHSQLFRDNPPMSSFTSNKSLGISVKALSLLASLALHAAVLATAALLIGETRSGPAESSSSLHVSVERIEPADESPKENPAPEISQQIPEQAESDRPIKPKVMVEKSQTEPQPLKIKIAPTKALAQKQTKPIAAKSNSSSSRPTPENKGSHVTENKPMQLAKAGNYSRQSRDYQSRLQRLVERHKYYPLQARRNGIQGKATVSFTIRRDGKIERIALSRSSGRSILDQAAITTIQRIGKAPRFPDSIKRTSWRFSMPIAYNLR